MQWDKWEVGAECERFSGKLKRGGEQMVKDPFFCLCSILFKIKKNKDLKTGLIWPLQNNWWFIQLGIYRTRVLQSTWRLINSEHALGLNFWSTLLKPLLGVMNVMCSYFYAVIRILAALCWTYWSLQKALAREADELPSSLEDKGVDKYFCRVSEVVAQMFEVL